MCAGGGGGCARVAPALLANVNLLIAAFAGAALATGARLKWDPSTYVAVRELFPAEYQVLAAIVTLGGVAMLLLGHWALVALVATSYRRVMLFMYAVAMALMTVTEVAAITWLSRRIQDWLTSETAKEVAEVLELREHIRPLLAALARWHPLPYKLKEIINEAEEDAPWNGYVGAGAGTLLLLLQVAAVVLAVLVARQSKEQDSDTRDINCNGVGPYERSLLKPPTR